MAFKFSAEFSNSRKFVGVPSRQKSWKCLELTTATEDIEQPTVWEIDESRHALIVHLGGALSEIETEINGRARKLEPPTAGECWLIPANSRYFSFARGETASYAEIYFKPDFLRKFLGKAADEYQLAPHIGFYDDFIYQAVKNLAQLSSEIDDISELTGESLSNSLCLHLFRKYNSNVTDTLERAMPFSRNRFQMLHDFICENLGRRITIEDLAGLAEMSSDSLLRTFHRSFGVTPAQYIIQQRLRSVRWQLSNTKRSITTIALETGFASHSHLSTTFKKHTGITPQQFRMMN